MITCMNEDTRQAREFAMKHFDLPAEYVGRKPSQKYLSMGFASPIKGVGETGRQGHGHKRPKFRPDHFPLR